MKKKYIMIFIASSLMFALAFFVIDQVVILNGRFASEGKEFTGETLDEVGFLLVDVDESSNGVKSEGIHYIYGDFKRGRGEIISIPVDRRVKTKGEEEVIGDLCDNKKIEDLKDTIENILGVRVSKYIKVDNKSVINLVDSLGGIEVDVPEDMVQDSPPINIKRGIQKFDGRKAVEFLTFKNYKLGEIKRVDSQQVFIKSLIESMSKMENLKQIDKIIKNNYNYLDTNIPMEDIIKYGAEFSKIDVSKLKTKIVQ